MQTAVYSGTPLAKKLGIKPGFVVRLLNEPDHYLTLFMDWPEHVSYSEGPKDFIHLFCMRADTLEPTLVALRSELKPNGMLWVSWPKKASGVKTDVTEDLIRQLALRNGLVDIKVCAIDTTWSGLKLVIPVKDRPGKHAQTIV